jgi:hypothetical protein
MLFHEVGLSRDQILEEIATALQSNQAIVFADSSLLLHCYEISSGARDELLAALGALKDRLRIPLWAARETWKRSWDVSFGRTPLKGPAARVKNEVERFVKDARRFVEDGGITRPQPMSKDEFQTELETAQADISKLAKMVADHHRDPDATSSLLIPFINERVLRSDLPKILKRVQQEAELRYAHEIPPGYADGRTDAEGQPKGKGFNRYGDVIIWFEILEAIANMRLEHLIVLTRDVKEDWVYTPKRLNNERGQPIANVSVTLADPLLVHEATQHCGTLKSVQILSLDAFAQVLNTKLGQPVPLLLSALQSSDDNTSRKRPSESPEVTVLKVGASDEEISFRPDDLSYEPSRDNPLDKVILELAVADFRVQNLAVKTLPGIVGTGTNKQLLNLGRALTLAANSGAREPSDYLRDILSNRNAPIAVRSNLLVGVLTAIYLSDIAELKKPVAPPELTSLLFSLHEDVALAPAFETVGGRMQSQSRQYLALPSDPKREITLEFLVDRDRPDLPVLRGILSDGHKLTEEDAPPTRRITRLARARESVDSMLQRIAIEFVVPVSWLTTDEVIAQVLALPDNFGFVRWGPSTGVDLR